MSTPTASPRALAMATGTLPFVDDTPPYSNELFLGLVLSTAIGRITLLDLDAARAAKGVVGVYTVRDLPGPKLFGPLIADEPLLADGETLFVGQVIAVVAATSRDAANAAKKLVRVEIDPVEPVRTIDDAIRLGRFIGPERGIACGDVTNALAKAKHRLRHRLITGGQKPIAFEMQITIAVPGDSKTLKVIASTQNPTHTQSDVAHILNLQSNQVEVVCPQMGGGFGGKETQSIPFSVLAALVATKTNRPVRLVLSRTEDMLATGGRHPVQSDFEVGFDGQGRVVAFSVYHYLDGGISCDLSWSIGDRAMFHSTGVYPISDVLVRRIVCYTSHASNTAFRGFGGPQGMLRIEIAMQLIAAYLGLDALDVRRMNIYRDEPGRNTTPYGQVVANLHVEEILARLEHTSDYRKRMAEILQLNQTDSVYLHGLALVPCMFGCAFTASFLNQGGALVNVYASDGTILVATGGTDMGEGTYEKIRQTTAAQFGVPPEFVTVAPTSTSTIPNTSATAASFTFNLNGPAAVDACRQIMARLRPHAASMFADPTNGVSADPESVIFKDGIVTDRRVPGRSFTFQQVCRSAYFARIDLGARGFHSTPGVGFNPETGKGTPFSYFSQSGATVQVRINRFTGELKIVRADILFDAGDPVDVEIAKGQVLGGFLQAFGWLRERLSWNREGALQTTGLATYKIPAIGDKPEFHLEFLQTSESKTEMKGSRALGEPPFALGSVACAAAIMHALSCLSYDSAAALTFPATNEELLRCISLADRSAESSTAPSPGSAVPAVMATV